LIGVEQGLAIAVALAILDQTWRSARPKMFELGRHVGTTSWEPMGPPNVELVDHALVALFDNDIFFANAGVFRREVHQLIATQPATKHFVMDAVAISDIDFTGMTILAQVVDDIAKDGVSFTLARVNDTVRASLQKSADATVRGLAIYESVDDAVNAVTTA
jgi:SulP family sulfate permease